MLMHTRLLLGLTFVLVGDATIGAGARAAHGQTVYNSRAAFESALTGEQVFDFNAVATGPGGSTPIAGIGPLTFGSTNGTQTRVVSPTFDPVYSYGTGNVLVAGGQNPLVLTFTSATPLTAFGIDFGVPTDPCCGALPITFGFDNGLSYSALVTGSGPAGGSKTFQFFGVTSPTAFTQATITVQSGAFQMTTFDNVTLAVVPEPATLVLLAAGLPVLGALARRRRAAAPPSPRD